MAVHVSHFDPFSTFHHANTFSDRLKLVKQAAYPAQSLSSAYRRSSHWSDDFVRRLDLIDVLGGSSADDEEELVGHTGCVNALAWSQSGDCLATGSDDQRVILWRIGSDQRSPSASFYKPEAPNLAMAQTDVIETGHSANIFSVKWAPNSGDKRLFTCAGDSQMRVFDLTRASSFVDRNTVAGKEYRVWGEGQGACMRVLRCHSGRAKRISTENSPDVFLSCAEDGEIRQTDLRVPHTCSRRAVFGEGCPKPLIQFQMELYSLSVSKVEPWLVAVAGTSDKVYLLDRRMVPRLLKREWGASLDPDSNALTHCIRRFAREPFVEESTGDEEEDARRRRRYNRSHVTAVKIAESNGRDLLASYSGDGLYRFDLKAEPGLSKAQSETYSSSSVKRRKMSDAIKSPTKDERINEKRRRRVHGYLFPSSSTKLSNRPLRHDVLKDLESLQETAEQEVNGASNRAGRSQAASQESLDELEAIALCQALMCVQKTRFSDKGLHLPALEEARSHLLPHKDGLLGSTILPLLDEFERAHLSLANMEIAEIRGVIGRTSEPLITQTWFTTKVNGGVEGVRQRSEALSIAVDPAEADSNRLDEGIDEETASIATERQTEDDATPENTFDHDAASLDESDSYASDGSEFPRYAISTNGQGGPLSLVELLSDDEIDDDDNEDDDDDDEDDDEMSEFASDESDEEVEDDRHGISGADAPIIYPKMRLDGHMNVETVKDCGFVGSNDDYIWSGSDCGHFFLWRNDQQGQLVGLWKGDDSVVNVLAQHPTLPVCAVSGIDDSVKLFGPIDPSSTRREDKFALRESIMEKNKQQSQGMRGTGVGSRAFMRMIARHMIESGAEGGVAAGGLADEQDCTVM